LNTIPTIHYYYKIRILSFLVAAVSFAVLCRTQTFAETYDPTPLTAAQILAKADQARGKRAPGNYVALRTERSRDGERRITTLIDGDDSRTTVDAGDFTYASGIYKGRSWSRRADTASSA
jgi:hypothetical protein